MEKIKQNPQISSLRIVLTILTFLLVGSLVKAQTNGQVTTPCTASMIATFTPCMNYITGSSAGDSTPSSNCCDALKSVMSSSMDCGCLMVTASVPLPQIVNRTLALGLPRICKTSGVPIQCQASSSPLPAPGPLQFGPKSPGPPPSSAFSPKASGSPLLAPAPLQIGATPSVPPPNSGLSPQASKATAFTPASEPTATGLPPVVSPSSVEVEAPSRTPRVRPVLTPSVSSASMISSPTTICAFLIMYMLLKL
ncbi:non-specific lipid transfer protein GPI-anchored 16 [Beta vulgaris subsp. vulgaris]|uniref:non-specific lipid transfer protein GPI-anchored 16 n=1 Tax=Beta vulgaris subsp. vulgaris TaxID=3555 RepID=UPI002036A205|nr:non-specific lipid transfer protein GPI-anchored 16 [Beta vulgaris subsp. vulgaris]